MLHEAVSGAVIHWSDESSFRGRLATAALDLNVETQVPLPVIYEGVRIDAGYRIDLIVAGVIIVEIKSVGEIAPIHKAQLLSYLRLSGLKVGLLLNFNSVHMRDGVTRMVR